MQLLIQPTDIFALVVSAIGVLAPTPLMVRIDTILIRRMKKIAIGEVDKRIALRL